MELKYCHQTYFSVCPFLEECLKFTIMRVTSHTPKPHPFLLARHWNEFRVHFLGLGTEYVALQGLKVREEL
jgi:hypothetical protein